MKKLYILFAFCSVLSSFSQYNENAPWMKGLKTNANGEAKFKDIVNSFNDYWKDRDFSKKGSGYKPFKRWENHWENLVNDQGYLATPQEIKTAFEQKKQGNASRNALSLPPSNWTPIGPFTHTNTGSWSSGQGRVNFVYVDPSNANTIYLGAPAGGIWKSTNNGASWTGLLDNLPQIGVSGIVVDHTNSNVIYIATGDKDSNDTYSIGVLKSTDGGATWNTTGLTYGSNGSLIGDIMMDPTNNQILVCATNSGIFRTINGGNTWTNVRAGNFSQGAIRFKPGNASVIYATTGSKFFKSVNNGAAFTEIVGAIPGATRILIDVTPNDANYVYALASGSGGALVGIFRSVDSGATWAQTDAGTAIFDGSTQAGYDLAFAVSPTNKDELYTGCLNVWKSIDGGATATKLNNWNLPFGAAYTHADIHYLGFYSNKLFAGTDGGIYVSSNQEIGRAHV